MWATMSYAADESLNDEVDRSNKKKLKIYFVILSFFVFVAISAPLLVWACHQTSSSKSTNVHNVKLVGLLPTVPTDKPNPAAHQKPNGKGEKFDKEITTTKSQGDSVTFVFRIFLTKSDPSNSGVTCSVQNTTMQCPRYMQTCGKFLKAEAESSMNGIDHFASAFEVSRLTFHDTFLQYQARSKFSMHSPSKGVEEIVFNSAHFDFNNRLEISSIGSLKANVIDSDPEFKDIEYVNCSVDSLFRKNSCVEETKAEMQKFTNWMRAIFGLKSLNVNMTVGLSGDWPMMMISDFSAVGIYQDSLTSKEVFLRVVEFVNQQDDWCNCMKTRKGKDVKQARERCFQIHSTRKEFRKTFEQKMCHL